MEIGNDGWKFPIGDPTFEFTSQPDGGGTFVQLREGGKALADRWRDHISQEIRFGSLMEQLPNPDNTIAPAFDPVDAIGIPRPRITFTIGRYVPDGLAEAAVLHERLFDELQATERHHVGFPFGAGHIMGRRRWATMRPTRWSTATVGATTSPTCTSPELERVSHRGNGEPDADPGGPRTAHRGDDPPAAVSRLAPA